MDCGRGSASSSQHDRVGVTHLCRLQAKELGPARSSRSGRSAADRDRRAVCYGHIAARSRSPAASTVPVEPVPPRSATRGVDLAWSDSRPRSRSRVRRGLLRETNRSALRRARDRDRPDRRHHAAHAITAASRRDRRTRSPARRCSRSSACVGSRSCSARIAGPTGSRPRPSTRRRRRLPDRPVLHRAGLRRVRVQRWNKTILAPRDGRAAQDRPPRDESSARSSSPCSTSR